MHHGRRENVRIGRSVAGFQATGFGIRITTTYLSQQSTAWTADQPDMEPTPQRPKQRLEDGDIRIEICTVNDADTIVRHDPYPSWTATVGIVYSCLYSPGPRAACMLR